MMEKTYQCSTCWRRMAGFMFVYNAYGRRTSICLRCGAHAQGKAEHDEEEGEGESASEVVKN